MQVPLLGHWEFCSHASPKSPWTMPSPQYAAEEDCDDVSGPPQYSQPNASAPAALMHSGPVPPGPMAQPSPTEAHCSIQPDVHAVQESEEEVEAVEVEVDDPPADEPPPVEDPPAEEPPLTEDPPAEEPPPMEDPPAEEPALTEDPGHDGVPPRGSVHPHEPPLQHIGEPTKHVGTGSGQLGAEEEEVSSGHAPGEPSASLHTQDPFAQQVAPS